MIDHTALQGRPVQAGGDGVKALVCG